jgi:ATP-dependent RNA helicase DDX54/DBP10
MVKPVAKAGSKASFKKAGAKSAPAKKSAASATTSSAAKKSSGGAHFRKGKGKKAAGDDEDMSDFEEVAMSDSDVDMEDSLVPRKKPMANLDLDDLMGETIEEEEEFIASANMVSLEWRDTKHCFF